MSDDDIWRLNRGGHDPHKMYAAYAAAMKHKGQPTVILAKTIKGYGMGESGEGQNITHQQKKMGTSSIKAFRDRFSDPDPGRQARGSAVLSSRPKTAPEMQYLRERVQALGGILPARRRKAAAAGGSAALRRSRRCSRAAEGREISTTMAFVRMLNDDHARQEDRQVRRADRTRRVAHVRHGRHVPPARHLFVTSASSTRRRTPTS